MTHTFVFISRQWSKQATWVPRPEHIGELKEDKDQPFSLDPYTYGLLTLVFYAATKHMRALSTETQTHTRIHVCPGFIWLLDRASYVHARERERVTIILFSSFL